jgi:hypothetical protein
LQGATLPEPYVHLSAHTALYSTLAHGHGDIDEPEKTIEPTVRIAFGPCRELVLHFADYQRSSPHWVR